MLSKEELDKLLPLTEQQLHDKLVSCAELWQVFMAKYDNDKVKARKAMIDGGVVMSDDLRQYNSNPKVYKYPNTWENVQYNNGLQANASARTEHMLSEAGVRSQFYNASPLKLKKPAHGELNYVSGKPDSGKTYYVSAYVNDAIAKRKSAKYMTFEEYSFAKAKLTNDAPNAFDQYGEMERVSVLAIDGCEGAMLTEKQSLGLASLITKRSDNKLTTFITARGIKQLMDCCAGNEQIRSLVKRANNVRL